MSKGPKRTTFERERDLAALARLYCKGRLQVDIAAELGISQQQVSYDLGILRARWLKESMGDISAKKAAELAKVDHLEQVYWDAWTRSLQDHQITSTKKRDGSEGGILEASMRREQGEGEPRYLEGVQWCIERRCRILGLDAPTKADLTSGGEPIKITEMVIELPAKAVQEASD